MPANLDLKWACTQYAPSKRRTKYRTFSKYYDGEHDLAFATEKFRTTFGNVFKEFTENLCPAVVDSLADRLEVTGFQSSDSKTTIKAPEANNDVLGKSVSMVTIEDPQGQRAIDIWDRNRMDGQAGEVHQEAIKMGDAYVLVWPNEKMQAEIWPQCADEVSVQYDPNNKKQILRASKVWWNEIEKKWYLNIYTRQGITKYISRESPTTVPVQDGSWVLRENAFVPNPYEQVPMFHFAFKAERKPGTSRLRDIVPLQDGLNKSVMDMLIAMEFASYKQRYIIGIDPEINPETGEPTDETVRNYGVDRIMGVPDPDAKVGQFDATDLAQFLKVQEKFWASVARVSGTPLHYFLIVSGDFPSGEAMKSAEARFSKEIQDCHTSFGNTWEDVMLFAMKIDGPTPADLSLDTLWTNPTPRTESELADTAVKKQAVGVSRSQILHELGYDDVTIQRMLEESDAHARAEAELKKSMEQPKEGQTQDENNTRGVRQ